MSIRIDDHTTLVALAAARGSEEVHGPDGQLLGYYTPLSLPGYIPEVGMTVEELDRIRNDPNAKWVTPEEVMDRLREIDQCSS